MTQRPPTIPNSTYRLQFTPNFGFRDAEAIVPYLHALGVGHLYASPYLKARPGSMHGYDVVDPNALNPEIGTPEDHAALVAAHQALGMGQVLDFVPNHMGIGPDNPWWTSVLEWGERSPYAKFFDIDFRPLKPELRGKVLVPKLGDHYGTVLEAGDLRVTFDRDTGTFAIAYFENTFPLACATYAEILTRAADDGAPSLGHFADRFVNATLESAPELKRELAAVAHESSIARAIEQSLDAYAVDGKADDKRADALDALLQSQHYRLAFWRVAFDEINYRRFFDVNDLAGLRVEDAEVLAKTHQLIFDFIARGVIQGLRIDHVDGLYNPGGYCNLLAERAAALDHHLYVVVEKILAPFERLRASWDINGTTGYEFANLVNGLFVDSNNETAFDRIYARAIGRDPDYEELAFEAKRRIMSTDLASELSVLANELARLASTHRRSSDFTFNGLRTALTDVIAAFPVYRTYVVSEDVDPEDIDFIEAAVAVAIMHSSLVDESIFAFIADVLTLRAADPVRGYDRIDVLNFAMHFQQYTSPVMAKSIEDTLFYRYVRLISLNEVGGEPRRFGTSVAEFHAANAERAATRPTSMLTTSTHDHKRGEDVRTRIDVLSEVPGDWSRALRRWSRINRTKRGVTRGAVAPEANAEYFLYQTIVGTWPPGWSDPAAIDDEAYDAYVERIVAYFFKAQREAKQRTSWSNPDTEYEERCEAFVRAIFERGEDARFPGEIAAFVAMLTPAAMISSLAQVVLKCTSPGLPDIYQGCELWDHSLVDPDNRRAVDYALRARMLEAADADPAAARASWEDGHVKLLVTARLLRLRARFRATFLDGPYTPLDASGPLADRLVAFARGDIVTIVPRLIADRFEATDAGPRPQFGEEAVALPDGAPGRYRELFTDAIVEPADGAIAVAPLLGAFPVAVLVPA